MNDRISHLGHLVVALAAAVVLAAGCSTTSVFWPITALNQPVKPSAGDQQMSNGQPQLALEVVGRAELGRWVDVRITVGNPHEQPVVLLGVSAHNTQGGFVDAETQLSYACKRDGDQVVVEGTLLVEDIGAMARLPAPPRWSWEGSDKLVGVVVLGKGERFKAEGRFRLTHKHGKELRAVVRYAVLPDTGLLLQVGDRTVESLEPKRPQSFGSGGWAPTTHVKALYAHAGTVAVGEKRVGWHQYPSPPLALLPTVTPTLFANALAAADLEALRESEVRVEDELKVEAVELTLAQARKRAKIEEGPAVYHPDFSLWALESTGVAQGNTTLVSAKQTHQWTGKLVWLVSKLRERDPFTLTLFEHTEERDPDKLVTKLTDAHFDVRTERRKGGGHSMEVAVSMSTLGEFLRVLETCAYYVDDDRVVRILPIIEEPND